MPKMELGQAKLDPSDGSPKLLVAPEETGSGRGARAQLGCASRGVRGGFKRNGCPHVQVLAVGEDLAAAFEVAQEDLTLCRLPAEEKTTVGEDEQGRRAEKAVAFGFAPPPPRLGPPHPSEAQFKQIKPFRRLPARASVACQGCPTMEGLSWTFSSSRGAATPRSSPSTPRT